MSQYSLNGWAPVRPPGWPSNWVRLWAPCRWTLSSPTLGGSSWRKVTSVRAPAGRRIVGPGKLPPKVQSRVLWPGRICCSAARIGSSIRAPFSSRGIGSGSRNGTPAAWAVAPSSQESARPRPPPGTRVASTPPPRTPRKARRPRRGCANGLPGCDSGGRRQHLDLALHPGMDRAHVVERGAGLRGHLLFDFAARFFTGEPGVAFLLHRAHRAPTFRADFDVLLADLFRFRVELMPFGDRQTDVTRGEARLTCLGGLRQRAFGDQREGVRADLARLGVVDDPQLFAFVHGARPEEPHLFAFQL